MKNIKITKTSQPTVITKDVYECEVPGCTYDLNYRNYERHYGVSHSYVERKSILILDEESVDLNEFECFYISNKEDFEEWSQTKKSGYCGNTHNKTEFSGPGWYTYYFYDTWRSPDDYSIKIVSLDEMIKIQADRLDILRDKLSSLRQLRDQVPDDNRFKQTEE